MTTNYVGKMVADQFGRRDIVKSQGSGGLVIDRCEPDRLTVATDHYNGYRDLAVFWDDFTRNYSEVE